jgi:hypothetical protein
MLLLQTIMGEGEGMPRVDGAGMGRRVCLWRFVVPAGYCDAVTADNNGGGEGMPRADGAVMGREVCLCL